MRNFEHLGDDVIQGNVIVVENTDDIRDATQ
jgi:hypothetical protein